jgi:hypothetical protein
VTAGLGALCHDGVHAVLLEVPRLRHGRGRGQHRDARGLDGAHHVPRRQPEVERHYRRPQLEQRVAPRLVELDGGRARLRGFAQPELVVERGEVLARPVGDVAAHLGRLVAEEVELEGPLRELAQLGGLHAELVHREHRRAERAEPAGLADRRGEGRGGGARHRGLEDRVLDSEQLGDGGPEHCETDPTATNASRLSG